MTYARVLTALADPTRREIFEFLKEGKSNVVELAARMPISRPAVSQHLKALKEANLVTEKSMGRQNIYCIDPKGLKELRKYLDGFWNDVLGSYEKALKESLKS